MSSTQLLKYIYIFKAFKCLKSARLYMILCGQVYYLELQMDKLEIQNVVIQLKLMNFVKGDIVRNILP